MVYSCCVIGCTARWSEDDKGFFRIPSEKEPEKWRLWLQSIRRADPKDSTKSWIPSSGDRVCKAHFLTGKVSLEFVAVIELPPSFLKCQTDKPRLSYFQG